MLKCDYGRRGGVSARAINVRPGGRAKLGRAVVSRLCAVLSALSDRASVDEKCALCFAVYDLDNDGVLSADSQNIATVECAVLLRAKASAIFEI